MTTAMSHVRKPSVAMWLSTFCCGLGQIYCGRVGRGLVMYCLSMMIWPLMAITIFSGSTMIVFAVFAALVLAIGLLNLWSASDARATARSMAAIDFEPREYNRPLVYGLMLLTWFPYVIGLALFLRANVVEAFYLPSSSMAPSFIPGDRILANKLGIETASFSPGDLVVFRNPQNRQQKFIKRIVGLPGDTVEIKSGQLLINGRPLEREPVPAADETSSMNVEGRQAFYEWSGARRYSILIDKPGDNANLPPQTVPAGSYFVLGDHRGQSHDSREFGAVSHGEIVGQVIFLYCPGDTWKRFGAIR